MTSNDLTCYRESSHRLDTFIQRYFLHILIFLFAFFFILTISNPAVFFNDEWITLNQLRQIDNGQQVIFNEGIYGVFKNGTSTAYFDSRERYLGYTLMLPVLSWPMLKIFSLFGDNFRLPVIFLWAFLPLLIVILISRYRPDYSRLCGLPWIWIAFIIMAGLLIFNLIFYYPFPYFGDTVPREIAAVVFTQYILFAILAVVIFSIIHLYTGNSWYSIFSLIICLGCSSYIFWATNAKDHLLTVTLLAVSLFFLIRYLKNANYLDGISGFITIGLLAWARPEFALVMFGISTAFFILINIYLYRKRITIPFPCEFKNLLLPLATVFGSLPFFLNNYYVNKNPLSPTFLVYLSKNGANGLNSGTSQTGDVIQSLDLVGLFLPMINKIISHFSIYSPDLPGEVLSILISPQNGAISVLAIVPMLLISIIVLVYLLYSRLSNTITWIPWIFVFLFLLLIGLPLAYIGKIHGLNISLGITPDIRYLSPTYLVISLFGVFLIYQIFSNLDWKKITLITMGVFGISVPINLYMLLLIFTGGGTAPEYIRFYNVFSVVLACIAAIFFVLSLKKDVFKEYFPLFLGAMVTSPFSWQILLTYFFASAKINGYPFWVPLMEIIYNSIIFAS